MTKDVLFSVHNVRNQIAFAIYSAGIWLSFVGIATVLFMFGYAAQLQGLFLPAVGIDLSQLGAQAGSADQLYTESTTAYDSPLPSTGRLDVITAFLALGLSFLALALLLMFAGYAARSRRSEQARE